SANASCSSSGHSSKSFTKICPAILPTKRLSLEDSSDGCAENKKITTIQTATRIVHIRFFSFTPCSPLCFSSCIISKSISGSQVMGAWRRWSGFQKNDDLLFIDSFSDLGLNCFGILVQNF